jgi:two-component system OmpR family sensor kinase
VLSHWTLRRRLLVGVLSLLTAVGAVIAMVSVLVMDDFLTERLDEQLTTAVARSQSAADRMLMPGEGGRRGRGPDFLMVPGQAEQTLGALVQDGVVTGAAVLDPTGAAQRLTPDQAAVLVEVPVDGTPHTVDLGGDVGEYRVAAVEGSGGTTLVTGLALGEVQRTVTRLALVITAVALLGLVVAGVAGAAIVRSTLRPLARVAATATRVSELPLDRGEVALAERVPPADTDPGTEVGQVGAALNRLLGHVEAALTAREASETKVRQFVADASHELRTPLASIRGYAELTRRTPYDLPPDVLHAMSRVESEAVRMTGLVDDLLLLARLDAAPGLQRTPVDLSTIVVNAVADARAAGPDHAWSLALPEQPVVVEGDPQRLHQLVANLLANARVHTPPGTPVSAGLSVAAPGEPGSPGQAVLTVVDEGPGIPDELQPQVFERFARGDRSRSRAAGSTGLGLAIVAAVAQAHGGRATVESRPGRTAFVVHLPLHRTATAVAPTGASHA